MPKRRRTCEIITMHSDKTKPTQKPLEMHRPGRALWSLCLLRTGSLGAKDRSLEAPLCHPLRPPSLGHNGRAEGQGLGPRCSGCASGASPASPGYRGPATPLGQTLPSCHRRRAASAAPHIPRLRRGSVLSPSEYTPGPPCLLPGSQPLRLSTSLCHPFQGFHIPNSNASSTQPLRSRTPLLQPCLPSQEGSPDTVVTPPHLKVKPLSPEPEPALLSQSGNSTDGPAVCPAQDG